MSVDKRYKAERYKGEWYKGEAVTLEQLLDAREARAERQREWLSRHSLPLISFTVNMVGEIKVNPISTLAFEQGLAAITGICRQSGINISTETVLRPNSGFEYLAVVDSCPALQIKQALVSLEESHLLGRLFDIDVIDIDARAVSRDIIRLPRRKCIVCEQDAKLCARSRAHSQEAIIEKMIAMVESAGFYFQRDHVLR